MNLPPRGSNWSWLRATLLVLACGLPIAAVNTVFWRMASFRQFSHGSMHGLSLSREGRLRLAPDLRLVFHTQQALIWSVAADHQGDIFLGTGHEGRIYRLTPAALAAARTLAPRHALWFTAPQPEVFALAVGPDGALYAGTSPDGKVYRIAPDGHASVYFDPHEHYIWALAFTGRTLYVGTGDRGEIYRVTGPMQGGRFFDTRQSQVMALAAAPNGDLLAGSEPGGLIFRITPAGRAFVLYNSPLEEIHRLTVAADGSIYVTAQGAPGPMMPNPMLPRSELAGEISAPPETVTIAASSGSHLAPKPGAHASGKNSQPAAAAGVPSLATPNFSPVPRLLGMRSAVYRITSNQAVDTLWSSKSQDADDVLPTTQGLLVSTDHHGRIYRLGPNRQSTILVQTNQEETTRLLRAGPYLLATTANRGDLYRLGGSVATRGWFVSPVKDTGEISHWGDLEWLGRLAPSSHLTIYTRSGNSPRPDRTWSDWAAVALGQRILSPAARYIQWKAAFVGSAAGSPYLDEVVVPYLPVNLSPEILWFHVRSALSSTAPPATPPSAISAEVMHEAEQGQMVPIAAFAAHQTRPVHGIQLSWKAADPDGDRLRYQVYFQAEGETGWKLLQHNLHVSHLSIGSQRLPDGVYRFKLVASDAPSNPPAQTRRAEAISPLATLDTAAPSLRLLSTRQPRPGEAVARFSARDPGTVLVRAADSIDAGPWRLLYSDDGIIDSRHETFTVRALHLPPGEHLLMLRIEDAAGNQNSIKVLVNIPASPR